jgi:hypothetical protein
MVQESAEKHVLSSIHETTASFSSSSTHSEARELKNIVTEMARFSLFLSETNIK